MEKVTYSADQLPGYVFGPTEGPAIVVLQEWFGVTDTVKEQAQLLSEATGFRTMVPDLYHGKIGVDAEEAAHLMGSLDWVKAKDEMVTAVEWLKSTGATKVGCVGFCMGGALTLIAAQFADVSCAAPCYGTPSPPLNQYEKIEVPVLGTFGEVDGHKGFSDPDTAKAVFDKLKETNSSVELHIYPGCDHGFLNGIIGDAGYALIAKNKQVTPPKEQVQLAFDRIVAFMKQNLSA